MSQSAKVEPEYTLESVKTHLTEKQLVCLNQTLLDLEVVSKVLSKELESLAITSGNIASRLRESRQSVLDLE